MWKQIVATTPASDLIPDPSAANVKLGALDALTTEPGSHQVAELANPSVISDVVAQGGQVPAATQPQQQSVAQAPGQPPAAKPAASHRSSRTYDQPTQEDIDTLLRNPHLRNEFEYRFGPAENPNFHLTPDQLANLPERTWDPATMLRPTRGIPIAPPRGGAFTDDEGNRLPSDRLPTGSYVSPEPGEGKVLPLEGFVATKDDRSHPPQESASNYPSEVFDPYMLYRTEKSGAPRIHTGTDFAAPVGTPAHAVAGGVVFIQHDSGKKNSLGNVVGLRHPDGTMALYCHLQGFNVKPGDIVQPGDQIGTVGLTGNAKTNPKAPHLHLEILAEDRSRSNGGLDLSGHRKTIDPMEWLKRPILGPVDLSGTPAPNATDQRIARAGSGLYHEDIDSSVRRYAPEAR